MKRAHKPRHEMSIDELIEDAGWFSGSDADWRALPLEERDRLAFAATGCAIAYATWPAPVNCLHTRCQILRGELPPIVELNRALLGEKRNWLKPFTETKQGRKKLAALFRGFRKLAREKGVYDPWELAWPAIVFPGVMESAR